MQAVRLSLVVLLISLVCGCNEQQHSDVAHEQRHASNSKVALHSLAQVLPAGEHGSLLLASGNSFPVREFSDSLVLINYWAVWCAPCRIEIPELNALYAEQRVKVLGVDFDRHQDLELHSAIADMGIKFPVLTAQSAADLMLAWPEVLPVTLVIVNRRLSQTLLGPQTRETLHEAIRLARGKGYQEPVRE